MRNAKARSRSGVRRCGSMKNEGPEIQMQPRFWRTGPWTPF